MDGTHGQRPLRIIVRLIVIVKVRVQK